MTTTIPLPIKCSTIKKFNDKFNDNAQTIGFWCFTVCAVIMTGMFVYVMTQIPLNPGNITATFICASGFIFFSVLFCPYNFDFRFKCKEG
jgi:hypothetical protein